MLGHYALVTFGYHRRVQRPTGPDHGFREVHLRRCEPLAQFSQQFPPPRQRFVQQAASRVIEQIKHDVPHGTPAPRLADAPRVGQAVPAQQARHLAASEGHVHVVEYLIAKGVNLSPADRRDGTSLSDAWRNHHEAVITLLEAALEERRARVS